MFIRSRDKNGLLLSLSSYKKLKAFQSGGYFWDPTPQGLIRQYLGEFLPAVETSKENGDPVGWFRRFSDTKEVLHSSKPLAGRGVPEAQLNQLGAAFQRLREAALAADTQQHNRDLIEQFRLPDPERDPELYRLRGPIWNRRLEILWGCEKANDTSLLPGEAISRLRTDRLYSLKKWLFLAFTVLAAVFLLWLVWTLARHLYALATNQAPVASGSVRIDDPVARRVVISNLRKSADPDGTVELHIVDWGDGTKESISAEHDEVSKTYAAEGDYKVAVSAVDNLRKFSPPRNFPVVLNHERKRQEAEAELKQIEEQKRAAELQTRKRAAEDQARAEADKRVIEEAAEKARKEAEELASRRIAEERARAAAEKAAAERAEAEKAEAAKKAAAERPASPAPPAGDSGNPGVQSSRKEPATAPQSPAEPSEFKDISTGRPVKPISFNKPSYPRSALQANEEGSVRVQFTVDKSGRTKDIKVIQENNGYHFRVPVLDAIRKATFRPAVIDGSPVEQQLVYEINFVITKD